jgi:hypothetical protein
MSREPLDRLRDSMSDAPHEIDHGHLPARFDEARSLLAEALAKMKGAGIPHDTIVTAMLAEMLPRMVHQNGPVWAATMLAKLALNICAGSSPSGSMQ